MEAKQEYNNFIRPMMIDKIKNEQNKIMDSQTVSVNVKLPSYKHPQINNIMEELRTTGITGYEPKNDLGISENYIRQKLGETLRGIYSGANFVK